MMVAVGRWRVVLACLFALVFLVPGSAAPASAISPPPCNDATGIAVTDNGSWVLSSWDRIELRDTAWERQDSLSSPGGNNTYGVARGPNGSLWLLQSGSVVNVTDQLETRGRVEVDLGTEGVMLPEGNDLAYNGRWLVLFDGDVTSYNETWGDRDPDPPVERVVPEDTRGLYVSGDTYTFLTADRTLEIYERVSNDTRQAVNGTIAPPANGSTDQPDNGSAVSTETVAQTPEERANRTSNTTFVHQGTVSLDVSRDVVDVHPGPEDTLLILHPGNVTAVTSDGERIGQRASVFAPQGCDVDASDTGEIFAYLGLLVVGAALVLVSALVLATVVFVKVFRR